MTVRFRDGIEIVLSDGTRVVCDANRLDGDVNVVTHAHGDHTPTSDATAVCSPLTAALATERGRSTLHATTDERIELVPAGHVAGSRAALVTDPDGTRYCYTGDVSTRSRLFLDGFEPPDADVLVVETTYGDPQYVFPEHDALASEIVDWLADTPEPVVLFGYALGRAQKLQLLASDERAERDRVLTTDAVARVNDVIEAHRDVSFPIERLERDVDLEPGDALVLPRSAARVDWIDAILEESGAVKAGFSGWAVDDSYLYRGGYDATFPLSDHCDFEELVALVEAIDPDEVYLQHGDTDTFATELARRGYDATALRRNQATLGDF